MSVIGLLGNDRYVGITFKMVLRIVLRSTGSMRGQPLC